jgi:hypothetical protein
MPRLVVGVFPNENNLDPCNEVEIKFEHSNGVVFSNLSIPDVCDACEEQVDGLLWTACVASGPAVEWIEVTISQDADRTTSQRVSLAEHNYCGEDIAYVSATLHEDEPPTFGEILYVSPCNTGSL